MTSSNLIIALIMCPSWGREAPPLSIALLGANLRSKGFETQLFDLNNYFYHQADEKYKVVFGQEHYNFWTSEDSVNEFLHHNEKAVDRIINQFLENGINVYGFSSIFTNLHFSLAIAARIKQLSPDSTIIFGGPNASLFYCGTNIINNPNVDAIVQHEGDITLPVALSDLDSTGHFKQIPGLIFKRDNEIIDGGMRDPVPSLDDLPFADYTDFDLSTYSDPTRLDISSSRSCVNKCHYCDERNYFQRFRFRSGRNLFDEIIYQKKLNPQLVFFNFSDSVLNGSIDSVYELCQLLIINKINISWGGQAVVRKEMTPELLNLMHKAGCRYLSYGVECGSNKVLESMNKKLFTVELAAEVLKSTHNAGINAYANFMFGYPTETEFDFLLTLDFIKQNREWIDAVSPSQSFTIILKNTYLYDNLAEYNIAPDPHLLYWKTLDGKNTYPIRFKRYELFCNLCKKLDLKGVGVVEEKIDKWQLLGEYYFSHEKNYPLALDCYEQDLLKNGHSATSYNRYIECCNILGIQANGRAFIDIFELGGSGHISMTVNDPDKPSVTFSSLSRKDVSTAEKNSANNCKPASNNWNQVAKTLIEKAEQYHKNGKTESARTTLEHLAILFPEEPQIKAIVNNLLSLMRVEQSNLTVPSIKSGDEFTSNDPLHETISVSSLIENNIVTRQFQRDVRRECVYSSNQFRLQLEKYQHENSVWMALYDYRSFVNNHPDGKDRYEVEKLLRNIFPALSAKDIRNCSERFDLALVQAPSWGVNTPPTATATLTAFMRHEGYRVLAQDLNITIYSMRGNKYENGWDLSNPSINWKDRDEVIQLAINHQAYLDQWVDYIIGSGVDAIGFTIYDTSYEMSLYLAEKLKNKKSSLKIIFGGPCVSKYMIGLKAAEQQVVDVVVEGEGELTLKELMKRIKNNEPLFGCPGTIQNGPEGIQQFTGREQIKDLDSLPFIDFSDYNLSLYVKRFSLPAVSSRGCPNQCIFCNERPFWKSFRSRSANMIFEEMRHQLQLYPQITFFEFHDSLINGNVLQLEKLCDLIIDSGLKVGWTGQAAIRKEMTYELFVKLNKAGCVALGYGMETSSTNLMARVGKKLSHGADPNKIIEDGYRAGVLCAVNFMFGLPGETDEDFDETIKFLIKSHKFIGTVNPSSAFCAFAPGTDGYDNPGKYGIKFHSCSQNPGLFWESDNGSNNYPVRLQRFEHFCQLVGELGIETTYPHVRHLNREEQLKEYFLSTGDNLKAIFHLTNLIYEKGESSELRAEFIRIWSHAIPEVSLNMLKETNEPILSAAVNEVRKVLDTISSYESEELLERILVLMPYEIELYLMLTEIQLARVEVGKALTTLQKMMQVRPDFTDGHELLRQVQHRQNQLPSASPGPERDYSITDEFQIAVN